METGLVNRLKLQEQADVLIEFLHNFDKNRDNLLVGKGIYIYGPPGSGKTTFVNEVVTACGYDIVSYDTMDTRNKSGIDSMTSSCASNHNVLSMLCGKNTPIAIVMDDIEGMNTGDKGGINNMIKLIRAKKTKKQKLEPTATSPIICIGGRYIDKKIGELKNAAAYVIEIPRPSAETMRCLVTSVFQQHDDATKHSIVQYVGSDLRRLKASCRLFVDPTMDVNETIQYLGARSDEETTTKTITKSLLTTPMMYTDHDRIMSETDRTSVGLLFHENIIDVLTSKDEETYLRCLQNFCYADRIDRATFQKQIWSFNEMSSLIKTMYNQHIMHTLSVKIRPPYCKVPRFTKVLTKYSTEYNNSVFISNLCQKTGLDVKDLLDYFASRSEEESHEIAATLCEYEISKLDVNRILKLIVPPVLMSE